LLEPLATALATAAEAMRTCPTCGNLDTVEPCAICRDPERDAAIICVVEDLADLWALERTGAFAAATMCWAEPCRRSRVGPDDLNIDRLLSRLRPGQEMILALNATVEGQTTAHYLGRSRRGAGHQSVAARSGSSDRRELDYLDEEPSQPLSRPAAPSSGLSAVIFWR